MLQIMHIVSAYHFFINIKSTVVLKTNPSIYKELSSQVFFFDYKSKCTCTLTIQ